MCLTAARACTDLHRMSEMSESFVGCKYRNDPAQASFYQLV